MAHRGRLSVLSLIACSGRRVRPGTVAVVGMSAVALLGGVLPAGQAAAAPVRSSGVTSASKPATVTSRAFGEPFGKDSREAQSGGLGWRELLHAGGAQCRFGCAN